MSLSMPSRRLIRAVPALTASPTTTTSTPPSSSRPLHTTPPNQWFWRKKSKSTDSPLEESLTGTKTVRQTLLNQLTSKIEGPAMFEDEVAPVQKKQQQQADELAARADAHGALPRSKTGLSLAKEHLARALDPNPRARVRWERKVAIQQVRNGTNPFSREPREDIIARTERQHLSRSPWLATSTKKLVHLARQIQGKTLTDAMTQMRFSKKKMAQEVLYQLELARDEAVVSRGMGLGQQGLKKEVDSMLDDATGIRESSSSSEGSSNNKPVIEIHTKDGRWIKIDDPTRMYVAEAWAHC
ncbi:hypothetical protein VTJ49DRAFT_3275 [Mycothermus thermophilus]|uniref:Mitochondrial large ribosomal subunit n=1 Tax=Humicola insolens TaxID=85995 RepID=A0ABR3V7X7_HUMIN